MVHPETLQQSQYNPYNPQSWGSFNTQFGQPNGAFATGTGNNFGPGQAAYGQPWAQFGMQPFGHQGHGSGYGAPWSFQQRQLSQHEMGDVVRQLVPLLPHLIAQAQTQPQAAYGYGGFGNNPWSQNSWGQNPWGQQGRALSPQDVNEVVRQILPIVPQIVGALQGQNPYFAQQGQLGQWGMGQAFAGYQNPQTQIGLPPGFTQQTPFMAAFGGATQRQLSQQDVHEIARQLVAVIPQVIGSLQANQQRPI